MTNDNELSSKGAQSRCVRKKGFLKEKTGLASTNKNGQRSRDFYRAFLMCVLSIYFRVILSLSGLEQSYCEWWQAFQAGWHDRSDNLPTNRIRARLYTADGLMIAVQKKKWKNPIEFGNILEAFSFVVLMGYSLFTQDRRGLKNIKRKRTQICHQDISFSSKNYDGYVRHMASALHIPRCKTCLLGQHTPTCCMQGTRID